MQFIAQQAAEKLVWHVIPRSPASAGRRGISHWLENTRGWRRGKLSAATEAAVELFLCKIDTLAWDSAAARAYAKARATLERIGKLLANMDLLIAAHAAAVGAVLVTNDHTLEECSKYIDVRQTVNWADDVRVKP